jgi:type IV pilus assembly protein PilE
MKRARGFTLLELMIVVLVIAVLASLALSGYQKQIRKSRRAEAKQVAGDLALKQEKYRSNNAAYGTTFAAIGGQQTATYFTFAPSTPASGNCAGGAAQGGANSYAITATAIGDQANDTACATMAYTNNCGTILKTPPECW